MFPDSFLPQLLVFLAAQIAAFWNMRSGRFALGFAQFALVLGLADVLLVLRFVENETGTGYRGWLLAFQALSVLTASELLVRVVLTNRKRFRATQAHAYEAAFDAWLGGRDAEALQRFRRMFRHDPWHAPAACMVATILAGQGRARRARSWYGRAKARTRLPTLRDEIDEEVRCLKNPRSRNQEATPSGTPPSTPRPATRRPRPVMPGAGIPKTKKASKTAKSRAVG